MIPKTTQVEAVISDVLAQNPKKIEPVIVEFGHGILNPSAAPSVRAAVFEKEARRFEKSSRQNELVTVCEVDGMMYQGQVQSSKDRKLFLALRNKHTNKVQLIEVSSTSLMPVVTPPPSTNPLLMDKTSLKDKAARQSSARNLVHNFGSLKGQRLYDQAERLGVKAETVKANLEDAVQKTNVEKSEILPESTDSYEYLLPPCNRKASKPSEVYQESDIVTEDDLSALENAASICAATTDAEITEWQNAKTYSAYFIETLKHLKKQFKGDELDHKVKLLIYAECLIKFSNLKGFAVRRKDPLPEDFPVQIRQKVLNCFAPRREGSSERQFTKVDRERCICHVIILGLFIGDFSVDLKLLSNSLHMSMDKLTPLVRVVGAQYVAEKTNSQHFAFLEIPLAQAPRQGGIRRKSGAMK